jgi:hypothetical protein
LRVVRRRHTRRRVVHPLRRSTDYVGERGVDTLTRRFRSLKDGDSLYPWANSVLRVENGKRRWIAKAQEDY